MSRQNGANGDLGDGNTKSPKSRSIQSKHWCFTFNNYPEQLEKMEQEFKVFCIKYIYGKEIGDSGTKHLQGYLETNKKIRFEQLKKYLEDYPGIHLEKCRNINSSITYCKKDNDFYQYGFPKEYCGEDLIKLDEFRPYQKDILNIISKPANKRDVIWIYETIGNVGKSEITKYLAYHKKITVFSKGKFADIINAVYNQALENLEICIFDLPRNNGNKISYDAIESIKNGCIFNGKYETGQKLFPPPHVIIFANERPEVSKLSEDRWKIFKINENYELVQESCKTIEENVTDPLDQ